MSEPIEGTGENFSSPSPSGSVSEPRFDSGAEDSGASHKAAEVFEQGKEKAKELGSKAQEQVITKAEELRSQTAQRIHRFADAMEDLSHGDGHEELAPIANYAARYVRRAGDLIDERSAEDLIASVRSEVRQRPALVLLGMAAIGFFGARLLKE